MPLLPTPKSWQKLASHTIESWLASDDEREQHLADEALLKMGTEKAIAYLHQLLRQENKARGILHWKMIGISMGLVVLGMVAMQRIEPQLVGMPIFLGVLANFVMNATPKTNTKLQQCVLERCERELDVRMITLLEEASRDLFDIKTARRIRATTLPTLLRQITPETKHLVPEKYWQAIIESLKEAPSKVNLTPGELEYARADIDLCGNTRYEPALPYLEVLAKMDAKTPQSLELKNLAAKYVVVWNQPVVTPTASTPEAEKIPLVAGKWYVS